MKAGRLAVLVLLACSGLCVQKAHAQDPLGGAVLGVGLDNFANKIQQAIQQAIGGGLILEVGAGGQISTVISQAKAAYESDLNLTYSKLNAAEQQTVNSIASLADAYEKKTYADVADLEGRAAGIVHALPFSKTLPRVFSYSPEYATQAGFPTTLQVKLDGDFTDVVRRGLDASLSICADAQCTHPKGKTVTNSAKTNGILEFDVPFDAFDHADNKVSYTMVAIAVPYKESCYLLLSCDRVADFRVPISVLPKSAGVVRIDYKTTKPDTDTRPFTCPEQQQESVDDDIKCGGEHGDLAVHRCSADPGYSVIPNTVTWHKTWTQGKEGRDGDFWLESNCSSATTPCLCVSTEHHRAGKSGKVHFQIIGTETKPITTDVPGQQTITLGWEDNEVIELPAGATWHGTFTRFDGKPATFAGPFHDQYVSVYQNANVLSFRTIP